MEAVLKSELGCSTVKPFGSGGGGCINSGSGYIIDGEKVFIKYNSKHGSRYLCDVLKIERNCFFFSVNRRKLCISFF